jgi:hypothetical protein
MPILFEHSFMHMKPIGLIRFPAAPDDAARGKAYSTDRGCSPAWKIAPAPNDESAAAKPARNSRDELPDRRIAGSMSRSKTLSFK